MTKKMKVAIVGGGVAGVTSALYLAELGLEITLFEKEETLISGPPFCHLHAGGNLYREISDEQCITLLKQSIDFVKFYPFVVDYRPTVIAIPIGDKQTPHDLLPRLNRLQQEYEALIVKDKNNKVLGESQNYYVSYSKEEMLKFQQQTLPKKPSSSKEWMVSVAQHINLDKIQFPLILVQEYGLNLFRLSAGVSLAFQKMQNITLHYKTTITHIKSLENQEKKWELTSIATDTLQKEQFDYLINAGGFQTGKIDDMLHIPCKRMVEFKSAYVSYCETYKEIIFPEIVFHGERGTPQGMGQFTPYPHGYFQLHSMTHKGTLYKDGLVSNTALSCQPKLNQSFMQKIEHSWQKEEIEERTQNAISHLAQFMPTFSHARVASKPLFGAQQISGDDPTLRVAEVAFPLPFYARCEIIKVSSVFDMVKAIKTDLINLGYIKNNYNIKYFKQMKKIEEYKIKKYAQELCEKREYPLFLACRNIEKGFL